MAAAINQFMTVAEFCNLPEDDGPVYVSYAPDLVIEVLSPSNTAAEMYEKERLCLENGAREFWVIDALLRLVKMSTPDGNTRTYKSGQEIPLPLFGENRLAVNDILG